MLRVKNLGRVLMQRQEKLRQESQIYHHLNLNQYSAMVNAASLQLKQENSFLLTPQMDFVMMMKCVSRALVVMD